MSDGEYLKCPCKECGNNIEFPPKLARDTIPCPHCGEWTELLVPGLPEPHPEAEGTNLFTLLVVGALVLLLGGGIYYFSHANKTTVTARSLPSKTALQPAVKPVVTPAPSNEVIAATEPPAEDPDKSRPKSPDDLKASEVKLEKTKDSSLVYAAGTVKNNSAYQRFSVKIQMDIFNRKGKKIGTTQDYKDVIEPHKEWHFHALIPETKAAEAKITSLKED